MPDNENTGVERPTIDITSPTGGWPDPWPNVAEIAAVLPGEKWTLVGGLMTQLHSIHRGLGIVRPTNDVDIVLHIETTRGVADETSAALRSLGYDLRSAVDPATTPPTGSTGAPAWSTSSRASPRKAKRRRSSTS